MSFAGINALLESAKRDGDSPKEHTHVSPPPSRPLGESATLASAEQDIRRGLDLLVSGTRLRSKAVAERRLQRAETEQRNERFAGSITRTLDRPDAIVGNHALRVARKDATDAALKALDLHGKCRLIYDNDFCVSFVEEHKQVILREAVHVFSRTRSQGLQITVCGGRDRYESGITVESKSKETSEAAPELIGLRGVRRPSASATFSVRGVDSKTMAVAFEESSTTPLRCSVPPDQRQDLDLTRSEGSHIFTILRRHDPTKPVVYADDTFWQKTGPGGTWTNIVGWEAGKNDALAADLLKLSVDTMAFVLPASFRQLAATLIDRFRSMLVKRTLPGAATAAPGHSVRLIRPEKDTPLTLRQLNTEFDRCLDVLIAASRDCTITQSTLNVYRRKFRRYCLFSFAFYLLNRTLHSDRVSPLPFNFFNAFTYLYCHGANIHSGSYLNTLCFLNNYIFKPCADGNGPGQSMKRLVDLDYAFLKGGKATIREFGSPAKTSVHTRTVVSFLAFSEMVIGAMCRLLLSCHAEGTIAQRTRSTLERRCDGILFMFFTFVLFHRFSGVKKLDMRSALRLVLGQPHFHTSKAKAARLVRARVSDTDAKCEYDLAGASADTRINGMSLSHPHVLGLPFGIQARLGVPVDVLHPLVAAGNAVAWSPAAATAQYALGFDLPAPPPPEPDHTAGELGMFENVVSDVLDGLYGSGFTADLAKSLEGVMEARDPYSPSDEDVVLLDCSLSPGGPAAAAAADGYTPSSFTLSRDVMEYWRASPMRLVFVLVSDTSGDRTRYLSFGDMALLALWVKRRVLNRPWTSPAINPSHYSWLATVLCRHLLLADLTNFGIWGDVKCDQKLDCTTGRMHKNGVRVPTERDQRRFAKYTSLDDRKTLAIVHSNVNVRTRTHLGRVSSASWAVDAVRTVSAGDSAVFTRLAADVDTYHLAHTNAANFFPYYSSNCASNEGENGLWGYIRRSSENLAKAELQKGRFTNLSGIGVANTDVAAAAVALTAEVNLGEHEAVVDDASRRTAAKNSMFTHAANRSRLAKRRRVIDGVLCAAKGGNSLARRRAPPLKLKELWGWSTKDRANLLSGRRVRLVCPYTMFLAAAVPDRMILYKFDRSASLKLAVRHLAPTAEQRPEEEDSYRVSIGEAKRKLEDRAVITSDTTVAKYSKLGLAPGESAKRDIKDHDLKQRLARAGILNTDGESGK